MGGPVIADAGHRGHKNGIYISWGITDKQNKCMFYFSKHAVADFVTFF